MAQGHAFGNAAAFAGEINVAVARNAGGVTSSSSARRALIGGWPSSRSSQIAFR